MKTVTTLLCLVCCSMPWAGFTRDIGIVPKYSSPVAKPGPHPPSLSRARQMNAQRQLLFMENKGQVTDQYGHPRRDIDAKLCGDGLNVYIGGGMLHYQFFAAGKTAGAKIKGCRMDVELLGADKKVKPVAEEKQAYYENYYLPQCKEGVSAGSFRRLVYHDIYPHIDWVLYIKNEKPEYEFVLNEGAKLSDIKIRYRGAEKLGINPDGSITARTTMGTVTEPAPYCYQSDGKQVQGRYRLRGHELGFETAEYSGSMTIDPQLQWATYYGGGQEDMCYAVACDTSAYVYMAGMTFSFNNIATVGAYQETFAGVYDGFLAKFDSSGNRLWGTYYGGNGTNQGTDICVDPFGHIYLAGTTSSTDGIATPGTCQPAWAGSNDAFLVKFGNDGFRIWGTYYGGINSEFGYGVTSDEEGNVYLGGGTSSPNNIATPGAYKTSYVLGQYDAFLVKFDSSGQRQWGTYYGGANGAESINDISYDRNIGGMYVCGITSSPDSIATPGAYQTTFGGDYDAFIAKFDSSGSLLWGTYYGGSGLDSAASIIGTEGLIYLTGETGSSSGIATAGAYQPTFGGGNLDGFLSRFSPSGQLLWGTYYGGPGDEIAGEVCTGNGNTSIFICGLTNSLTNIATPGSHQDVYGGGSNDAYLAKFTDLGNTAALVWATYYSGTSIEIVCNVAADRYDNVYLTGGTWCSNNIATPGSYQPNLLGPNDAFLARFRDCDPPGAADTIYGAISICPGATQTYYINPTMYATSYTWILPPGWTGSSNTDSITVTASDTPGLITVIALNGCDGSDPTALSINVSPVPHPPINNNGGQLSTGSYNSYQWYYNGQPINGATNQNYTATQSGQYFVAVTNANGCSGYSDTILVWAVNVPQATVNR